MVRRALVLAILLAPLAVPSPAVAAPHRRRHRERVVIHPLKPLGLDADTVARLEDILRASVKKVPGMTEVGAKATRAAIAGTKTRKALHCGGQADCLASLGRRLHADVVVYGAVGGLGDAYTITLRAISAKDGTVVGRASESVGGKREVLIDGITRTAYELLRPDLYVGSIEVKCPVKGADVQVDGKDRGHTPLAGPILGLSPGRHALKIVKTGYSDFDKFVEVRFQRTTVVTIDLAGSTVSGVIYQQIPEPPLVALTGGKKAHAKPDPDDHVPPAGAAGLSTPPLTAAPAASPHTARWVGIGLLGAGAVAAAVGGYFGLAAQNKANDLTAAFKKTGGPVTANATDWRTMTTDETIANVLYVAGGVLAAGGGGAIVFDLATGPEAPPGAVSVLPVGPGGVGLTLTITR